ncbi:hypothetical protein HYH03_012515 [Edaphochlamys debaryana]|uniref:Post-SET domain-containing protein n=1 Tax=Edaphochlamys debaryana TaxID=47281 RepID=A0A835XVF7_9CHLO|nr:hypothetical protein HYH03_012515 [Edaphochlamys debaryana]|eukprot:KAG2489081.1 hypothetical protein HYH03_012515 [Edaphochlamys debaryana]
MPTQGRSVPPNLQVGASKHILLSPEWLENTNHSCDPNVFFNTEASALLALRAIAPGDELCFFYPSTEWAMGEPFACRCGAATCLGHVAGASALTPQQLEGRRLTPYIQQRLAEAAAAKAATAEAAKAAEAAAPGGGGSG